MTRLVHRETGSVVNVPEEKVATLYAMGYSPEDKGAGSSTAKKTTAKKASSSKSEK